MKQTKPKLWKNRGSEYVDGGSMDSNLVSFGFPHSFYYRGAVTLGLHCIGITFLVRDANHIFLFFFSIRTCKRLVKPQRNFCIQSRRQKIVQCRKTLSPAKPLISHTLGRQEVKKLKDKKIEKTKS